MTSSKYSIRIHPDVELDYYNAYYWYEAQLAGLGERFLLSVREKLVTIAQSPKTYGFKGKTNFREAMLDDFPYLIVYRIFEKQKVILVSSIHHAKKHPAKKYRRH